MGRTKTTVPKGETKLPEEDVRTKGVGEGTSDEPYSVYFQRCREEEALAEAPIRAYPSDAGHDLICSRFVTVPPGGKAQLPTNIMIDLPQQVFAILMPRWSTFYRKGLVIHPGLIDPGFRGEVLVSVYNPTSKSISISEQDRIGQLIFLPYVHVKMIETASLTPGDRKEAGMGSTGGMEGRKEGE